MGGEEERSVKKFCFLVKEPSFRTVLDFIMLICLFGYFGHYLYRKVDRLYFFEVLDLHLALNLKNKPRKFVAAQVVAVDVVIDVLG